LRWDLKLGAMPEFAKGQGERRESRLNKNFCQEIYC